MESIKNRIGIWRLATNKSNDDLLNELGMKKSAFYSKLNGTTEFSLSEAYKLAKILGCTVDDLFVNPISDLIPA